MTTTILTDEQIETLFKEHDDLYAFGHAIEQAVLQSPEVQALREDAEAFRLMVSNRLTVCVRELGHEVEVFHMDDCLAWPACDPSADDEARTEVARSAIATAAAAMEKQP